MLINPIEKSDLIRWDVPFAISLDPSVGVLTEDLGQSLTLAVAPQGLGNYPKYLVRFKNVVTLLCYEETCAIDRGYRSLIWSEADLCAYRWITSPWLKHYRVLEDILFSRSAEKLNHYLLFGGDTIVEVIALGEPTVEQVNSKRVIEIKHEV
jgi:hypothetical protein